MHATVAQLPLQAHERLQVISTSIEHVKDADASQLAEHNIANNMKPSPEAACGILQAIRRALFSLFSDVSLPRWLSSKLMSTTSMIPSAATVHLHALRMHHDMLREPSCRKFVMLISARKRQNTASKMLERRSFGLRGPGQVAGYSKLRNHTM
jgi:hypothetical protein